MTSSNVHDSNTNDVSKILKILHSSLKDYAIISVMTGSSGNGTPVIGGRVGSHNYTDTLSSSYLQFDFPEAPLLNYISFHLYDYDERVYTYSIDVLSNNEWKNVISDRQGQGIQYIHFQDVVNVKSIRMKGTNTHSSYFQIMNDSLSFKYTL